MKNSILEGIKFAFGFSLFFIIVGSVAAIGFHTAEEILPGTFSSGNFIFNGNIGIKNNNPQTNLDVLGTIRSTGFEQPLGGAGSMIFFTNNRSYIESYNYSALRYHEMYYKASSHLFFGGNVGINDPNPTASLDIESSQDQGGLFVRTTGAFTGTGGTGFVHIRLSNSGSTASALRFENAGTGADIRFDDKDTAPATCMRGDMYVDTSGAYCACTATNTWSNMVSVGSCS